MPQPERSTLAEYATMFRAAHLHFDDPPRVFEDPVAFDILEPPFRILLRLPMAFRAIQAMWPLKSARAQILVRSRYAEDRLDEAIARGVRQYVMLGAGFDTFSVRRSKLDPPIEIFELDLNENQVAKQAKLERLGHAKPDHLHYIPIDFELGNVPELLRDAGFNDTQPAFFSWLGVVHYLPKIAFLRTLGQLADCAAPGSELVFDYQLEGTLSAENEKVRAQVELATKTRGEPIHSSFTVSELERLSRRSGWNVVEDVPPAEQRRRYLADRTDGLNVLEMFSLTRLVRPPGGPGAADSE